MSCVKGSRGRSSRRTSLNLGGNTKAFVPFGGESLFCIFFRFAGATGGNAYVANGLSHAHRHFSRWNGNSRRSCGTGEKAGAAGACPDGTRGDEPLFSAGALWHFAAERVGDLRPRRRAGTLFAGGGSGEGTGCCRWSDAAVRDGDGAAQCGLWTVRVCGGGCAAGFHHCIAARAAGKAGLLLSGLSDGKHSGTDGGIFQPAV